MAKWYVAAKKADFNGIGQRFSISPVLARVIRNRDIEGEEAIEKYLHGMLPRSLGQTARATFPDLRFLVF